MDKLEKLQAKIRKCKTCQIPSFSYPLFQGSVKARVMVISQVPSKKVLEYGQKWRDNLSGKTLRNWFGLPDEVFYNQDFLYLTSIGKCYSGKAKSGDKLPNLICAEKWLRKEIALVKPKLIVTIGKFAFKWFFPDENYLGSLNGKTKIWQGIELFCLPHPSGVNVATRKKLEMEKIIENLRRKVKLYG